MLKYLSVTAPIKILSRNSNYIVDAIMPPKFGNSRNSLKEAFISYYKDLISKNTLLKGWYWPKLNNLDLTLVMTFKFYTIMKKGQK